jgi:hypothetical protein
MHAGSDYRMVLLDAPLIFLKSSNSLVLFLTVLIIPGDPAKHVMGGLAPTTIFPSSHLPIFLSWMHLQPKIKDVSTGNWLRIPRCMTGSLCDKALTT